VTASRREHTGEPRRPDSWAEELARAIKDLKDSFAPRDRRERIRRLLDAVGEHYRATGEPEPTWLTLARDLCNREREANGTE
jgi:hypothetical protein